MLCILPFLLFYPLLIKKRNNRVFPIHDHNNGRVRTGCGVVEVCLADKYDKRIGQFYSIDNLTGKNRKK